MKLYDYSDKYPGSRIYSNTFTHNLKSKIYNEYISTCRIVSFIGKYHDKPNVTASDYSFDGSWVSANAYLSEGNILFRYWGDKGWIEKKRIKIKLGLF